MKVNIKKLMSIDNIILCRNLRTICARNSKNKSLPCLQNYLEKEDNDNNKYLSTYIKCFKNQLTSPT
jgi:hypothetical protein